MSVKQLAMKAKEKGGFDLGVVHDIKDMEGYGGVPARGRRHAVTRHVDAADEAAVLGPAGV